MKIGAYAGESVESAKPRVRKYLIEQGFALPYAEPENKVISRSSDDCIVALMDQWYIDYGEESWKQRALDYLHNGLNTFGDETRNSFDGVLNWLNQWACARSFGLGSRLPWDTDFLVESLSDSVSLPIFFIRRRLQQLTPLPDNLHGLLYYMPHATCGHLWPCEVTFERWCGANDG